MMRLAWWVWLLVPGAAVAQVNTPRQTPARAGPPDERRLPEIAIGVFEHGANFHPLGSQLFFPRTPVGVLVEGAEEDGTVDIQFVGRTAPLRMLLKPRLAAKLQISTAGRTSFASVGSEWRQHAFHDRIYGQVGIGLTVIDGYRVTPDPFTPGLSPDEALRRYDVYRRRTSFGSRVLFNPNAALGVRIAQRWSVELTWEHYSHGQMLDKINPGIDNLGLRLVRKIGRRR